VISSRLVDGAWCSQRKNPAAFLFTVIGWVFAGVTQVCVVLEVECIINALGAGELGGRVATATAPRLLKPTFSSYKSNYEAYYPDGGYASDFVMMPRGPKSMLASSHRQHRLMRTLQLPQTFRVLRRCEGSSHDATVV
jgi:hypothetical protein